MRARTFTLALFSVLGLLHLASTAAAAVEYVRVCTPYGASYYYSPETDSCVNAITGEVRTQTAFGTMRRQTYFTARVRGLESDFCDGCFAVVTPAGGLPQSQQVSGVTRLGVGQFQVVFEKPVNKCALNATLGSFDRSGVQQPPGVVTVGRTTNVDNKGVFVWTYNMAGALQDRAFHLSLECEHKAPFCTVTNGHDTHVCTPSEIAGVTGLGPEGP